ncbi:hypothetical protein AX774_g5510 [Zancudomyces culisetae]|uniref:Uncharacterized protein n=1 Tax=Zancudomyces culisetae TaxID=1213189 RepID=A0A1R1PJ89_ZANCU|nr:hypothetical protein AX774_g5510 [Zancudomyces culisetae]|eukprot:OMH81044.1 hypothetical protein AX774_g5510 [Zancudomyces culisetae]
MHDKGKTREILERSHTTNGTSSTGNGKISHTGKGRENIKNGKMKESASTGFHGIVQSTLNSAKKMASDLVNTSSSGVGQFVTGGENNICGKTESNSSRTRSGSGNGLASNEQQELWQNARGTVNMKDGGYTDENTEDDSRIGIGAGSSSSLAFRNTLAKTLRENNTPQQNQFSHSTHNESYMSRNSSSEHQQEIESITSRATGHSSDKQYILGVGNNNVFPTRQSTQNDGYIVHQILSNPSGIPNQLHQDSTHLNHVILPHNQDLRGEMDVACSDPLAFLNTTTYTDEIYGNTMVQSVPAKRKMSSEDSWLAHANLILEQELALTEAWSQAWTATCKSGKIEMEDGKSQIKSKM